MAKETAGAQDAPNKVNTIDSATPRMMAATSVPLMATAEDIDEDAGLDALERRLAGQQRAQA